jgi:hypothetical protein
MLVAGGATADETTAKAPATKAPAAKAAKPASKAMKPAAKSDEVAVLDTSKGRMVVEFWEKDAPLTVANIRT